MDFGGMGTRRAFARLAWTVLAWNIPVILWGAYVRASFSGDGCGANWPLCNGQLAPQHMAAPMAIEFTHRVMTGVDSIAVIALAIWAFLSFPRGHAVRRFSIWSLVFLLIEALLGAGLVLFRLVAHDQSAGRALYLSAHLTNTLLLLAALTITAWLASARVERIVWTRIPGKLWGAALIVIGVSITGAIAALGDMLFPASSISSGVQQDFSSAASALLRLRMLHPFLAVLGAGYIVWIAAGSLRASKSQRAAAGRVIALVLLQLIIGAVNIALLAPIWMQLVHLLMADLVWIAVVWMTLETAAQRETVVSAGAANYASFPSRAS